MQGEDMDPDEDLDPLAPVYYSSADDAPAGDRSDADDGGFSDGESIVRIWLADGRLTKVRVSPVWFAKLGERPLEERFAQAFALANIQVAPPPDEGHSRVVEDVEFPGLPRLSTTSLARVQAMFADVTARRQEARARLAGQQLAAPAPEVTGRSKGVTVVLNSSGRAAQVRFEPAWLDDAQTGAICTHVRLAALDAYARFLPAPDPHSELDDLAQEHRLLLAAVRAMLDPKETR